MCRRALSTTHTPTPTHKSHTHLPCLFLYFSTTTGDVDLHDTTKERNIETWFTGYMHMLYDAYITSHREKGMNNVWGICVWICVGGKRPATHVKMCSCKCKCIDCTCRCMHVYVWSGVLYIRLTCVHVLHIVWLVSSFNTCTCITHRWSPGVTALKNTPFTPQEDRALRRIYRCVCVYVRVTHASPIHSHTYTYTHMTKWHITCVLLVYVSSHQHLLCKLIHGILTHHIYIYAHMYMYLYIHVHIHNTHTHV